jgi:hypothetical protein
MQAATAAFPAGRTPADTYQAQAANFWRQLGFAATGEQVLQAPAPGALPGSGGQDERVEKLASLDRPHRTHELTDEEFSAAKQHLLEG